MERTSRVEPCEILRAAQHSAPSDPPSLTMERATPQAKWRLTMTLGPLDAFALGALVVSALALAWSMGAWAGRAIAPQARQSGAQSLEDVRRLPPVRYEDLAVDRGVAD